jgi:hypothetical protein|nr:MAG TPA: tail fiber assembly protein [Caudoviricetes sp.]
MIVYKNFTNKSVLSPYEDKLKTEFNVVFKESEDGVDWYELTRELAKKPTIKLVVTQADTSAFWTVVSFAQDSTGLPVMSKPFSLIEVETIPEDLTLDGTWVVDIEKEIIYKRANTTEEIVRKNTRKRKSLLDAAYEKLTPLTYASDLDLATEEDLTEINRLKRYIVELSKLDLTDENLVFPTLEN